LVLFMVGVSLLILAIGFTYAVVSGG
jgi:hypothetical protein